MTAHCILKRRHCLTVCVLARLFVWVCVYLCKCVFICVSVLFLKVWSSGGWTDSIRGLEADYLWPSNTYFINKSTAHRTWTLLTCNAPLIFPIQIISYWYHDLITSLCKWPRFHPLLTNRSHFWMQYFYKSSHLTLDGWCFYPKLLIVHWYTLGLQYLFPALNSQPLRFYFNTPLLYFFFYFTLSLMWHPKQQSPLYSVHMGLIITLRNFV